MRCKWLHFVIAVGWHGRGQRFESSRAYHLFQSLSALNEILAQFSTRDFLPVLHRIADALFIRSSLVLDCVLRHNE